MKRKTIVVRKTRYYFHIIYIYTYTRCGNITFFFIMHGNQVVEIVAEWVYFYSRDEIIKFP